MKDNGREKKEATDSKSEEQQVCGIIMPIAGRDGYTTAHWEEVRDILYEVISDAGFIPNVVSYSKETAILHSNIVTNLADNPIVVCDVSSKNPNVMFELGLRLAFDKAVVVIKDEKTDYSFDTSPIEHLSYPSDLNYWSISKFKTALIEKIKATVEKTKEATYSPFLKHFVAYKPKKVSQKEVDLLQYFDQRFQQNEIKNFSAINNLINKLEKINDNSLRDYSGTPADVFEEFKLFWREGLHNSTLNLNMSAVAIVDAFAESIFNKLPNTSRLVLMDSPIRKSLINYLKGQQSKIDFKSQ